VLLVLHFFPSKRTFLPKDIELLLHWVNFLSPILILPEKPIENVTFLKYYCCKK
jgi:hypothetical protein